MGVFSGIGPGVDSGVLSEVSASDLVRNFGIWQDRARRSPVVIHHRGRPSLVMAAVELIATDPAAAVPPDRSDLHQLIDALPGAALLFDRDGRLVARNAAAAGALSGGPGDHGDMSAGPARATIARMAMRVAQSGVGEQIAMRTDAAAGSALRFAARAINGHALVLIENESLSEELEDRIQALEALTNAIELAGNVARARINPRGFLVGPPSPSLARLTGLEPALVANARLTSLIDITSRAAVAERIDTAFRTGLPDQVEAGLLVNRADPLPVRIGLAPVAEGAAIGALEAVIAPRSPVIHS